jgi:hypothetical protein
MALKKSYASTISNGIEIIPQRDVDMHPLEEAMTLKNWAIHEHVKKIPPKPSIADEHEWLIQYGAEYIKQKRAEWQKYHDAAQPAIQKAEAEWREAETQWNLHAQKCHAHGLDYDTHPDGRNLPDKEIK